MDKIQDYVFYAILKNNQYKEGYSYGIKRGISKHHDSYFVRFMDMSPYPFCLNCLNWNDAFEKISADGNIIIANAAVEIEDIKNRYFVVYLPTYPTPYQLDNLETIKEQLKDHNIDVGVYGEYRDQFIKDRIQDNFNSHDYLENYINIHKYNLENNTTLLPQTGRQKVKVN